MKTLGMKTLGIIPAREGSKRLPGKNVRLLAGKPLVAYAVEAALGARTLDVLVVSSDDEEVLRIARTYDPALPLRRPKALAADTSPAIDYVRHALEELEGKGESPFDAVVIVQPTSPLTEAGDVDRAVRHLSGSGADSVVSVVKLEHAAHPFKMKVLEDDRLLAYVEEERGRRAAHELPDVYVRNGAVYAARRRVVEAGQIIGDDCRAVVMPRERSVDINDEMDLLFAEFLMSRTAVQEG